MSTMRIDNYGRWKIWWVKFNDSHTIIGRGVYHKDYKYCGTASNVAQKMYCGDPSMYYVVSPYDPFNVPCAVCGRMVDVYPVGRSRFARANYLSLSSRNDSGQGMRTSHICDDCIGRIATFIDVMRVCKQESKV